MIIWNLEQFLPQIPPTDPRWSFSSPNLDFRLEDSSLSLRLKLETLDMRVSRTYLKEYWMAERLVCCPISRQSRVLTPA